MHLPFISYFVSWHNVRWTVLFGILGVGVCLAACGACWHQIINTPDD